MWPWEHLAFGYMFYSLLWRVTRREPPSEGAALVVVFGTQLPDLIDKPLSWAFGVFPTGHALGHSILVAVPVALLVLLVARRYARLDLGVAYVVGHLSHIVGDVVDPLRYGDDLGVGRALWPIVTGDGYGTDYGLARGLVYLSEFVGKLGTLDLTTTLLLYATIPLPGVLLWLLDGAPGPRGIARLLVRGILGPPVDRPSE